MTVKKSLKEKLKLKKTLKSLRNAVTKSIQYIASHKKNLSPKPMLQSLRSSFVNAAKNIARHDSYSAVMGERVAQVESRKILTATFYKCTMRAADGTITKHAHFHPFRDIRKEGITRTLAFATQPCAPS